MNITNMEVMRYAIADLDANLLPPRRTKQVCKDCDVGLTEENQYAICRNQGQRYCKLCWNEYSYLRSKKYAYGLEAHHYIALLKSQEWKCPICQARLERRDTAIDHDHTTKKVRGVLCRKCNTGLGHFLDRQESLARAIEYLRNPPMDFTGLSSITKAEDEARLRDLIWSLREHLKSPHTKNLEKARRRAFNELHGITRSTSQTARRARERSERLAAERAIAGKKKARR